MVESDIPSEANSGKKRFFYTDSLAASWMAKYHGMRFIDDAGNDIWFEPYGGSFGYFLNHEQPVNLLFVSKPNDEKASFLHPEITFRSTDRAYIHPDSLSLLEPRVGDWGTDGEYSGKVGGVDASLVTICVPERHNGKSYFCCPRAPFVIEKRYGILFMAPESEDA
jgi:hypothetical protein